MTRTVWALLSQAHRYGGRQSHALAGDDERTLCGKFSRSEIGDYLTSEDTVPTCKKCRDRDPRRSQQERKRLYPKPERSE